jgi:hypothetical protein
MSYEMPSESSDGYLGSNLMNKLELESLLEELDEALLKAFPGPEPMSVLVVGGACLLFQEVTNQPTALIRTALNDSIPLYTIRNWLVTYRPPMLYSRDRASSERMAHDTQAASRC